MVCKRLTPLVRGLCSNGTDMRCSTYPFGCYTNPGYLFSRFHRESLGKGVSGSSVVEDGCERPPSEDNPTRRVLGIAAPHAGEERVQAGLHRLHMCDG